MEYQDTAEDEETLKQIDLVKVDRINQFRKANEKEGINIIKNMDKLMLTGWDESEDIKQSIKKNGKKKKNDHHAANLNDTKQNSVVSSSSNPKKRKKKSNISKSRLSKHMNKSKKRNKKAKIKVIPSKDWDDQMQPYLLKINKPE